MNRSNGIAIAVFIAIVVVIGGLFALTKYRSTTPSTSNTSATSASSNTSNSTNPPANSEPSNNSQATDKVSIKDMMFNPATITVKAGTSVTWTNNDGVAHTVTENDGQTGPDSGDVNPGSTYSFTFKTAGTYKYHCAIHPNMTGTVVVTS